MSLFDSFSDGEDVVVPSSVAGASIAPVAPSGELSLFDSFSGDEREPPSSDRPSGRQAERPASATSRSVIPSSSALAPVVPVAAPAQRQSKRGRPLGTTAEEMIKRRIVQEAGEFAAPEGVEETLSEKRSRAVRKRWHGHEQRGAVVAAAPEDRSMQGVADLGEVRLVPHAGADDSLLPLRVTEQMASQLNLFTGQPPQPKDPSAERSVARLSCQQLSKASVARQSKRSTQTVTRTQRLLAFCIVIARRYFNDKFPKQVYNWLCDTFGVHNVLGLYFSNKYRYDEMSLTVNMDEGRDGSSVTDKRVAKLLQVTCWWVALFKIVNLNKYIVLKMKHPTTLRSIEQKQRSMP